MFGHRHGSSTSTLGAAVWGQQPGQGSPKGCNHWKKFCRSYHMFKCGVFFT